jgi:hypothetical protein
MKTLRRLKRKAYWPILADVSMPAGKISQVELLGANSRTANLPKISINQDGLNITWGD